VTIIGHQPLMSRLSSLAQAQPELRMAGQPAGDVLAADGAGFS
jgi:phosphohistidine phosphatase SixA